DTKILAVTQDNERNVFDQRWLEYELLEKHSIRMVRQTLTELEKTARVDPTTRKLYVEVPKDLEPSGFVEISVVYFRSVYTPVDFPTQTHYTTRFLLERSTAIKCPSLALQLAGGKKVQEVLTQAGVLEKFLADEKKYTQVFSKEDIQELRDSFMGMWGLDVGEDLLTPDTQTIQSGKENFGVRKARDEAKSLVLKPQREGGGNNVYKEDIPAFLDALPPQERQAWIAMQLIETPANVGNYLIRAGSTSGSSESQVPVRTDVISELGIFGWSLFRKEDSDSNVKEDTVGWLVRTKGTESNEGGVATGFSVLDSVVLVEG
ncbi:Glutathione synthetase, partial [Leucoagaricus sp. SymC.cos]